jgi:hypothetical protein
MLYGIASRLWRGYVGFGTGAGQKQSLFHATPGRRILEKVPGTSLPHARKAFRKVPRACIASQSGGGGSPLRMNPFPILLSHARGGDSESAADFGLPPYACEAGSLSRPAIALPLV